jgi:hypothetical protein
MRVGDHPAYVVVDVSLARGGLSDADWKGADLRPLDGRAVVRVLSARLRRGLPEPVFGPRGITVRRYGLRARLVERTAGAGAPQLRVELLSAPRTFKFVAICAKGRRIVFDMFKAAPPTKAAEIHEGIGPWCQPRGAMVMSSARVIRPGLAQGWGEIGVHRFLFYATIHVVVRGTQGRVIAHATRVLTRGWTATLRYHTRKRQVATYEASSNSTITGLFNLVQVRVVLPASER